MPAASVAVQVIACVEPLAQTSVPVFGAVTTTIGGVLSIGTAAGSPAIAKSGMLLQLRSFTDVTVMLPGPTRAVLFTLTLKSSPLSAFRSEEHTSELQSRGLISYAVFC